jgi:hypothetical protein
LLHAILVPTDEIFLTYWRGPDADAVAMAARSVGLGPDRVIHVEELMAEPGGTEPGRIRQTVRNGSGK